MFSTQYQQRPVPLEGNLVRRAWFRYFSVGSLSAPTHATKIVQSWDVAMQTGDTNDYSVCTAWRADQNDVYLIDVFRGRLEYRALRRKVIALAEQHACARVLIEDVGPGMNLLQDLRCSPPAGLLRPIGVKPQGGKLDRMAAQTAKLEAGHVHLLESAPWLSEFLYELLAFPSGRHDDQVDSLSQFLFWWQREQFLFNIPIVAPIYVSQPRSFPG
jgi:predicted phage terminase large subunit-like protein